MSVKKEIENARQVGFVQGIAYCVATYLSIWEQHPWIKEVWRAAGMSVDECSMLGVDEHDMNILIMHREYLDNIK